MCSIFGFIAKAPHNKPIRRVMVADMINGALNRGRDGIGAVFTGFQPPYRTYKIATSYKAGTYQHTSTMDDIITHSTLHETGVIIGNARAEPTTEWVKEKNSYDQQPYTCGKWSIVHNGTIANDKDLRTNDLPTTIDSAAIAEDLNKHDTIGKVSIDDAYQTFIETILNLKGSFAILATHSDFHGYVFTACNYRPIWTGKNECGMWIASEAGMLPHNCTPEMQEPYTCNILDAHGVLDMRTSLFDPEGLDRPLRALVVASGGLDSTVAAKIVQDQGMDVTLVNFQYGCRAESNEMKAVKDIAVEMGVPFVLFPIPIYDPKDSPLFDHNASIAGGEAGAEFAHEWVPARNLVMLSVATAYAEANGFDYIVLGNNLEEAGAYPDNEPEFINKFNAMLPFAVGDGKRVRVLMPVGNLMKHEIVAQGLAHAAPLHLTWSCYRNGEQHCGTCGPCMMRKTAFDINRAPEVISYANEAYEKDDGPLTEDQIKAIREASSASSLPDSKFNKTLL